MTDTLDSAPVYANIVDAAGLYRKLAEVVAEVEGVGKDGRNDFHRYDYTSAEAIMRAIRGPLSARNVVLLPSLGAIDDREITTQSGKASTVTTARVSFTFIDGDTGAMHKCEWAGRGDDPADKGLSKAYTSAIKTFLRESFQLPQGDDPEADTNTDKRAAERVGKPRSVTARPAEPTESVANAKQRGLINHKASEKRLDSAQLATILLAVAEKPPRDFESPEAAQQFVNRNLDRLPARLVNGVLAGIEQSDTEDVPF